MFTLLSSFILIILIYVLARPLVSGAVYFDTSREHTELIMRLAELKPGENVCDLGSGDGRILIESAKLGAEAHGYEIDPVMVFRSRRAVRREGLQDKAFIHWQSFWSADLSSYNIVIVYGCPKIMARLGKKLKSELKQGTKVISNIYEFPGWKPKKEEKKVRLYVV